MDLIAYLLDQGCLRETAEELVERKQKNPKLSGCTARGANGRTIFVKLDPPSTERVNAMLASGVPPGANTDREFLHGVCNGNQFEHVPGVGDQLRRVCEKNGGSVKGKKYISQLARFAGDPQAWVAGRGDVEKVAKERGLTIEGAVNTKGPGITEEPAPAKDVADHIVNRETAKELSGQTVTKREYLDKREKVKKRLTPSWKKK